jgi:undecaprenyl-diphosphatase
MLNGLLHLDTSTYLWLKKIQHNFLLSKLNLVISHSGNGQLYAVVALGVCLLQPLSYQEFFKVGFLAFCIELPSFLLLKSTVKRNRPFVKILNCTSSLQPSDKFSMPSGHTAAAFLMAGLISNYYLEYSFGVYCWACMVGNSRVATGVHYPSDVIAGAALGSSSLFLSLSILSL